MVERVAQCPPVRDTSCQLEGIGRTRACFTLKQPSDCRTRSITPANDGRPRRAFRARKKVSADATRLHEWRYDFPTSPPESHCTASPDVPANPAPRDAPINGWAPAHRVALYRVMGGRSTALQASSPHTRTKLPQGHRSLASDAMTYSSTRRWERLSSRGRNSDTVTRGRE